MYIADSSFSLSLDIPLPAFLLFLCVRSDGPVTFLSTYIQIVDFFLHMAFSIYLNGSSFLTISAMLYNFLCRTLYLCLGGIHALRLLKSLLLSHSFPIALDHPWKIGDYSLCNVFLMAIHIPVLGLKIMISVISYKEEEYLCEKYLFWCLLPQILECFLWE